MPIASASMFRGQTIDMYNMLDRKKKRKTCDGLQRRVINLPGHRGVKDHGTMLLNEDFTDAKGE